MNLKEKKFIEKLISKYSKSDKQKYFLTPDSFSNEDIIAGAKTLLKKQITMSVLTKKFEKEFARYVGAKYALMVNSGSSANFLSMLILKSMYSNNKNKKEVIVPTLTWVSDINSVIMSGFKPIIVDINPKNLAMDENEILKKINKNIFINFF